MLFARNVEYLFEIILESRIWGFKHNSKGRIKDKIIDYIELSKLVLRMRSNFRPNLQNYSVFF